MKAGEVAQPEGASSYKAHTMTTIENNELIAEFMGIIYKHNDAHPWKQKMNEDGTPYREDGTLNKNVNVYVFWNPEEWKDLMPVVDKCFKDRDKAPLNIIPFIEMGVLKVDKKATYKAVTEFINWYNEQKKNQHPDDERFAFYRGVESFLINKYGWTQEQCEGMADLDCYDQYYGTSTARETAIDIVALANN